MHKDITFEFRDKDWLYQKYIVEKLTCEQISKVCNCHNRTIHQRLVMFSIPRRTVGVEHLDESQKENIRQWHKDHPSIATQCLQQWHRDHPESNSMRGKNHSDEAKRKMSEVKRGCNHPQWKGGLTQLVRGIRRAPEYYQWRKTVLERDNFICQDCGSAGKVDAHHIQSLIDYPEGIFEVENGLALCKNCHKIHTSWQWFKRGRKSKLGKKIISQ